MMNFQYIIIQMKVKFSMMDIFCPLIMKLKKICRKCTIKKCKNCVGSIITYICISYIDEYYIPFDDKNRQNCKKCLEIVLNALETKSFDICISCENWPVLKNEKEKK